MIVLITTASLNSAFVQQEIGLARAYGKPLIPMVEKGIDTCQLGILAGIEYLDLDLDPEHQAETLAKMPLPDPDQRFGRVDHAEHRT